MRKQEFLDALKDRLAGLPERDVEDRLGFYREMIEDRIEEGLTEEEAVAQIGSVEEIFSQIMADIPLLRIAKEKIKPKNRMRAWEITLLAIGSPIWIALLVSFAAVIFSLYVSLWSVIVSLWAVFAALAGSALGCLAGGAVILCLKTPITGIACIGLGLVCAGLSIFAFFGCRAATKGTVWLTRRMVIGIKRSFIKKEVHHA